MPQQFSFLLRIFGGLLILLGVALIADIVGSERALQFGASVVSIAGGVLLLKLSEKK